MADQQDCILQDDVRLAYQLLEVTQTGGCRQRRAAAGTVQLIPCFGGQQQNDSMHQSADIVKPHLAIGGQQHHAGHQPQNVWAWLVYGQNDRGAAAGQLSENVHHSCSIAAVQACSKKRPVRKVTPSGLPNCAISGRTNCRSLGAAKTACAAATKRASVLPI